jgi:hypothetical protein
MDWMNEMGEMIAVDAPEMEAKFEEMIDSQIREIREAEALWGSEMAEEIGLLLRK